MNYLPIKDKVCVGCRFNGYEDAGLPLHCQLGIGELFYDEQNGKYYTKVYQPEGIDKPLEYINEIDPKTYHHPDCPLKEIPADFEWDEDEKAYVLTINGQKTNKMIDITDFLPIPIADEIIKQVDDWYINNPNYEEELTNEYHKTTNQ